MRGNREPLDLDLFTWVPIWLLTKCLLLLFSRKHPWRQRPPSLRSWQERGTNLAWLTSSVLGLAFLDLVFLCSNLFFRWWLDV